MSEAGKREAGGEKNRDRRHGIKDILFLKSFFSTAGALVVVTV